MKDISIEEGNKLIAEFVQPLWELLKSDNYNGELKESFYIAAILCSKDYGLLKYNSSFNWLMPAWKKCYAELRKINSNTTHLYVSRMKEALIDGDIMRAWRILIASIEYINE